MQLSKDQPLNVIIKTRKETVFNGVAHTITSWNERGEFDILPFHANFITVAQKYLVLDKGTASERKFDIESGILTVSSNKIDVYIGV
jgi:F0F1-type ATP synthase epsilon subunit